MVEKVHDECSLVITAVSSDIEAENSSRAITGLLFPDPSGLSSPCIKFSSNVQLFSNCSYLLVCLLHHVYFTATQILL